MATSDHDAAQEMGQAVHHVLGSVLLSQPWYRKWANTITGTLTGLLTLAWWVLATINDVPAGVVQGIGALLFAATALGLSRTPNGVTPSVIKAVDRELDRRGNGSR